MLFNLELLSYKVFPARRLFTQTVTPMSQSGIQCEGHGTLGIV